MEKVKQENENPCENESGKIECGICHNEFCEAELTEFEGEYFCPECLEIDTVICRHCGERIWKSDNAGDADFPLCEDCYDEHYVTCNHCNWIIHREDAYYENDCDEPYCYDCYTTYCNTKSIRDYGFKPEPIFYGKGNRFFGVELEVDDAGEDNGNADEVMNIANRDGEYIYCKHDGSLSDGFEIVTHPMSLAFHQNEMPWEDVLNKLKRMGYLSHMSGTCGLHVHINRSTFGNTEEIQDQAIGRVLYFFEKHWDELLKFSRRTNSQLNQWAARYGYKEHPKEILDHAKKGLGNGRYSCINLLNRNTVEFRMFRGTLKLNTIIATLQLVNRICDVAISLSDDEMKNLSWTTFVSDVTETELIQYLKERRIYVNEPIQSEEDV